MANSGVKAPWSVVGKDRDNVPAAPRLLLHRPRMDSLVPGSKVGDGPSVAAMREEVQDGWADGHGDRPHATVAESELTGAGVIAAELGPVGFSRPERQGGEGAGRA